MYLELVVVHINFANVSKNVLFFCASKDTIKRVKRQPTEWEKIFVNHLSDRVLICKIYKELLKLNKKKKNNPVKKWTRVFYFSKVLIHSIVSNSLLPHGP